MTDDAQISDLLDQAAGHMRMRQLFFASPTEATRHYPTGTVWRARSGSPRRA